MATRREATDLDVPVATRRFRWRWAVFGIATISAVASLANVVATARARLTAPPWPPVAGVPYEIPLGPDGCPAIDEQQADFVDAPGQLVPLGATEVVLCAKPDELFSQSPLVAKSQEPRQRVLRAGVAEFVAMLNTLPTRNEKWQQW